MLDAMAERYGVLPTEVLERGTTMDIYIFDIATKHRNLAQKRAENPNYKPTPKLSQTELKTMLDRVRKEHGTTT